MTFSRRQTITGLAAATLCGTALVRFAGPAAAQDADIGALHQAGSLDDKILGDENAPVTIVEYASITCPHCAAYHRDTYPTLKSKYIDTGKVRLIFREFPTQPAAVAIAGFMLARCAGERYFPMLDVIFEQQRNWASDPYNGFLRIARQAGFSQERFDSCLKDEKLAGEIQQVAQRAVNEFKVESTPTFFINGKRYVGALSVAELEKILDPLLKAS